MGALLLNAKSSSMKSGSYVVGLARLVRIVLGENSIASLLDAIGNCIYNSTRIDAKYSWLVEGNAAANIIERQSVSEPLQTGIIAVDSMVPIGRGQRELILGDQKTGKTSIALDAILNQKYEKVFSLLIPIGQRASSY